MEKFITGEIGGEKFSAFVTGCPDDSGCEHSWDGEEIMSFHNDERVMKRSQFNALPEEERNRLNQSMGECSCSKCGMPYTVFDNPYYH